MTDTLTRNGSNGPPPEPLAPAESERLAILEESIAEHISSFIKVGSALLEIRQSFLYREHYGTFEAYVKDRWGLSKSYAYSLISATSVVENLKAARCPQLPKNQLQARALVNCSPEQQVEIWKKVSSETRHPTAGLLQQLANQATAHQRPNGWPRRKTTAQPEAQPVPPPPRSDRSIQLERNAICTVLHKRLRDCLHGYGEKAKAALELIDRLGEEIAILTADPPRAK
ncbi:MAG: hypothetical protein ACJ8FY_09740 [Gemmataceae bacterium]